MEKVKKIEKGEVISIEDRGGNKHYVHGSIHGFTIKVAESGGFGKKYGSIVGLDNEWIGKRVLCILLE